MEVDKGGSTSDTRSSDLAECICNCKRERAVLTQLTNEPYSGNETERRIIMLQNIEHYGLKLRCNVLGNGNSLFSAVCDQLVRLKITRR